eukprot:m51a1_g9907 hypothetical protein (337) ;mRNA; f:92751-94110
MSKFKFRESANSRSAGRALDAADIRGEHAAVASPTQQKQAQQTYFEAPSASSDHHQPMGTVVEVPEINWELSFSSIRSPIALVPVSADDDGLSIDLSVAPLSGVDEASGRSQRKRPREQDDGTDDQRPRKKRMTGGKTSYREEEQDGRMDTEPPTYVPTYTETQNAASEQMSRCPSSSQPMRVPKSQVVDEQPVARSTVHDQALAHVQAEEGEKQASAPEAVRDEAAVHIKETTEQSEQALDTPMLGAEVGTHGAVKEEAEEKPEGEEDGQYWGDGEEDQDEDESEDDGLIHVWVFDDDDPTSHEEDEEDEDDDEPRGWREMDLGPWCSGDARREG